MNACIITTDKQPPYYPDLALVVADKPEVRIDVEIDEPYVAATRAIIEFSTSCTSPLMRAMMSPLRSSEKNPSESDVIFW